MRRKITKKEFAAFKGEVERLVELFGMKDWNLKITHKRLRDCVAQCCTNVHGNVAEISITTVVETEFDYDWNLLGSARHEFCHLFTARLEYLARGRFLSRAEIDECSERMAVIFEKVSIK